MRDIDKGEENPGFPKTLGTVSEKTLGILAINARFQGWHSIADNALQRAFIGSRLGTVEFVLSEYARNGQRAIEEALLEIHFREYTPIRAGFSKEGLEEVQRSVLQYKLNKLRKDTPNHGRLTYTYDQHDPQYPIYVGYEDSNLAPVFHRFSARMIIHIIEDPNFKFDDQDAYDTLRILDPDFKGRVKDEIDIFKENLEVMDTLFGFGKRIRFENASYSVVSTPPLKQT